MSEAAIEVAAFYQFATLPGYASMREPIRTACAENGVRGICLLASEGINGTLAGPPAGLNAALAAIRSVTGLEVPHKSSFCAEIPFKRLKVRLKKEIVTLGKPVDPTARVGAYVPPEDWNALIADPDVIVVDTRNHFEFEAGTFARALDPGTHSFGQFPAFVAAKLSDAKDKRIAMFCTGGIRCEKATAYLLDQGFENVFHLEGGILKYLEEVPEDQSLWRGGCFVFDERVALGHGLKVLGADLTTGSNQP